MKDKDLLGLKLKEIMEEDSRDIGLSSELIDNIISSRKKTWRDTVHDFLNREIEISIAPIVVGIVILFIVTMVPKDIFKDENIEIIKIGNSQMIIREGREVVYNDEG
ncbi:hypothetical protein ACTNDY_11450 [Tissierellaceae bacterium HCP3S3_D8]